MDINEISDNPKNQTINEHIFKEMEHVSEINFDLLDK